MYCFRCKQHGHIPKLCPDILKTKVKVAAMAIQKMNQELSKLPDDGDLPTWWTNKVAIAVDKLDGMSDYLDTKVESVTEANMSDVKKQLGKVKGLSKDAYNQLVALPMPVLTTMVNQLSGIVSSTQVESVKKLKCQDRQDPS